MTNYLNEEDEDDKYSSEEKISDDIPEIDAEVDSTDNEEWGSDWEDDDWGDEEVEVEWDETPDEVEEPTEDGDYGDGDYGDGDDESEYGDDESEYGDGDDEEYGDDEIEYEEGYEDPGDDGEYEGGDEYGDSEEDYGGEDSDTMKEPSTAEINAEPSEDQPKGFKVLSFEDFVSNK